MVSRRDPVDLLGQRVPGRSSPLHYEIMSRPRHIESELHAVETITGMRYMRPGNFDDWNGEAEHELQRLKATSRSNMQLSRMQRFALEPVSLPLTRPVSRASRRSGSFSSDLEPESWGHHSKFEPPEPIYKIERPIYVNNASPAGDVTRGLHNMSPPSTPPQEFEFDWSTVFSDIEKASVDPEGSVPLDYLKPHRNSGLIGAGNATIVNPSESTLLLRNITISRDETMSEETKTAQNLRKALSHKPSLPVRMLSAPQGIAGLYGRSSMIGAAPSMTAHTMALKMHYPGTSPEFPTHLTSMESSVSETSGHPFSSQEAVDTRVNASPYKCTYHGCIRRFETPLALQKHKRDYHRRQGSQPQSTVSAFVPVPGEQQNEPPARRYEEIDRIYLCGYNGCEDRYGTLNHLNTHVIMESHGQKRTREEFAVVRKQWKARKKQYENAYRMGNAVQGLPYNPVLRPEPESLESSGIDFAKVTAF